MAGRENLNTRSNRVNHMYSGKKKHGNASTQSWQDFRDRMRKWWRNRKGPIL